MYPTSTTRMRIHPTCCSRLIAFSSRGQSAGELEQPPHARVAKVGAGAEHHRAGAGDHADVVLPAILDGLRRHARALSQRLMHPDTTDLGLGAVRHDAIGDLGPCDDHDAIHPARDGLEVGITAIAREGLHVRIDWEDVAVPSSSTGDRSGCRPGDGSGYATRPPPRRASARESRSLWFQTPPSS